MSSEPPAKSFFAKYRDIILFNKNLIIGGTCGLASGATASQIFSLYDSNQFVDSIIALAADYGAYLPVFGYLFYRGNRGKYIDEFGRKNTRLIRADLKKLLASFSVSELIYAAVRTMAQYQLLYTFKPYEASIAGELLAWVVFLLSINLMTKAVKLFKRP